MLMARRGEVDASGRANPLQAIREEEVKMDQDRNRKSRRRFLTGAGSLGALATVTALPGVADAQTGKPVTIRIGYQFGLVYAPVIVMKELDFLKRYSTNVHGEFRKVASGAVVRDQVIAKRLDIGVLGPPPFLTGWQFLDWKYVVGTGIFPFQLVTWRSDIKSLKDFKPDDKIAVPGPNSLQSILLAMGAKKYLGDAHALKRNLISLPHPDAAAAIMSKNPNVAAHFANIPFLFEELAKPFVHPVLDGFDAFGGPFTSPLAFAAPHFAESNPHGLAVFMAAYNDAVALINLKPAKAARAIAPVLRVPADKVEQWLRWPGITYTSLPYGVMGWHHFMLEAGIIKKGPKSLSDVCSNQMLAWIGLEAGNKMNPVQRLQERGSA